MLDRLKNGFLVFLCMLMVACGGNSTGGGKSDLKLSGAIFALDGELVLSDGLGFSKHFYQGGVFDFTPIIYEAGDAYNVYVVVQPAGQICEVTRGQGVFVDKDVTNIEVVCRVAGDNLSLSGSAVNLVTPITVSDGLGHSLVISDSGPFSFEPVRYNNGDRYFVSILDAGPNQSCDIFQPAGTFAGQSVDNVQIFCTEFFPEYPLVAEVSGLKGSLTLEIQPGDFAVNLYSSSGGIITEDLVRLRDETSYDVTLTSKPDSQTCELTNGSGVISGALVWVTIACSDIPVEFELSGTVTGSTGAVTLADGLGGSAEVEGDGSFSFGSYLSGSEFAVTVVSQPAGQICAVIGGSGILQSAVTDIHVVCRPEGIVISGTATGVAGAVVLSDGRNNKVTVSQDGEFYFPNVYESGDTYGIAIESAPNSQVCEVFYSTGTIGDNGVGDVQLVCRAPGTALNPCGPPIAEIDPARFVLMNKVFNFGEALGEGGFSSFESNLNDYPEVLFGQGIGFGSPTRFSVIEYQASAQAYTSLCSSPDFEKPIARILSFENDRYRAASLIAFQDGEIWIFNHTAGTLAQRFDTGKAITDTALGDVDNDGDREIVVLFEQAVSLYDANTFNFKQSADYGGEALAIGHFTQAQNIELATNRGMVLRFSPTEYQEVWNYSALGFGNQYLTAGDIDGDGLDEIIGGDGWNAIRAFNADTKGLQWDFDPGLDIDVLRAFDTDGDGVFEVLYGDGQHGSTYILEGSNAMLMQSFPNISSGVTDLLVADLDKDGNLELVRGTGNGSTASDYLDIIDIKTGTTDWINSSESGSYQALAMGDLNGDAIADYVYASPGSGTLEGGTVTAVNGADETVLWTMPSETIELSVYGTRALAIGDVDGDGANEVLVGADYLYDGRIYRLDGETGALSEQPVALESGLPVRNIAIANIDDDADMEIIASTEVVHTGASGTKVHIIDGPTFSFERSLPRLGSGFGAITSMEILDSDSAQGPLVAALGEKVYLLDPAVNSVAATQESFSSLAKVGATLLAGNRAGELKSIASDGSTEMVKTLCGGVVEAMTAVGDNEIAFVCEEKLGLFKIGADEIVWQSEEVSSSLGGVDSIVFGRTGDSEVILAGGNALYIFKRSLQ